MKKINLSLLAILFAVLVLELLVVLPIDIVEESAPIPVTQSQAEASPFSQLMQDVHVVETRNDSKEWELWANRAIGAEERSNLALEEVRAQFFSSDGVSFTVLGQTGNVETASKNMRVDGNVVTTSSNGYVFRTGEVAYDSSQRKLSSSTPVEVLGPKQKGHNSMRIRGHLMEADLAEGVMLIQNDVRAEKLLENRNVMAVISDSVEMSGKNRSLRFKGNVTIDFNGMKVTGPDALFHYNRLTKNLEKIELDGGVKVTDPNKWATSEKLNIDLAQNKFVFEGGPRVVQDNDEVQGDRIVFLDGGKKVKIENAKVKVSRERLEKAK